MTNLEALSAACNYPIEEIKLQKILIDNGLYDAEAYQGKSKAFDMCTADLYILIVTSANLSEGDFTISATDKSNLIKLADGIYAKYNLPSPFVKVPQIRNRSNCW